MRTVHKVQPSQCSVCGKSFSKPSDRRLHEQKWCKQKHDKKSTKEQKSRVKNKSTNDAQKNQLVLEDRLFFLSWLPFSL